MSTITHSFPIVDGVKEPTCLQVIKLENAFNAAAMVNVNGVNMAPYFMSSYAKTESYFAARDPPEQVPVQFRPRPAVAAVAADPANGVAQVFAQRAHLGGGDIPSILPSVETILPNVAAHQVTTAQHRMVEAKIAEAKAIIDTNTKLKESLTKALPTAAMEKLMAAELEPGVLHYGNMTAKQLMQWAINSDGEINAADAGIAFANAMVPFTPADWKSVHSMDQALAHRIALLAIIPPAAKSSPLDIMEGIHAALGDHPAASALKSEHYKRTPPLQQTPSTFKIIVDQYLTGLLSEHKTAINTWELGYTAAATATVSASTAKDNGKKSTKTIVSDIGDCHSHLAGIKCTKGNCTFPHLKENFSKYPSLRSLINTRTAFYKIPAEIRNAHAIGTNDRSKSAGNTPNRNRDGRKNATDQRDNRKTATAKGDGRNVKATSSAATDTDDEDGWIDHHGTFATMADNDD